MLLRLHQLLRLERDGGRDQRERALEPRVLPRGILGGQPAAASGDVVGGGGSLALVDADEREAEQGAPLPVARVPPERARLRARLLEHQLELLARAGEVRVAERPQRPLLDEAEVVEDELELRLRLEPCAHSLERLARLARLGVELDGLRQRGRRSLRLVQRVEALPQPEVRLCGGAAALLDHRLRLTPSRLVAMQPQQARAPVEPALARLLALGRASERGDGRGVALLRLRVATGLEERVALGAKGVRGSHLQMPASPGGEGRKETECPGIDEEIDSAKQSEVGLRTPVGFSRDTEGRQPYLTP